MSDNYRNRLWLVYAPPGQWSSGPSVVYDWQFSGEEPDSLKEWRGMNYDVQGPYILEELVSTNLGN
jgi:hypothetical protein